jgi:hypothetical protein
LRGASLRSSRSSDLVNAECSKHAGALLNHQTLSAFIRSVADRLRGDYKHSGYGKVILPFTVFGQWSLGRVIGKEPLPPRIGGEDLRPVLRNGD